MSNNYSEIINTEVNKLKGLCPQVFSKEGYTVKDKTIEKITFSNSKGFKLIFIYDVSRYIVGKHMALVQIKFENHNIDCTIEELMVKKHPDFDIKEYFDSERKQGTSRKLAYFNLINNHLLEVLL